MEREGDSEKGRGREIVRKIEESLVYVWVCIHPNQDIQEWF